MKKGNVNNKRFRNVKDKLEYIQKECREPELFDDLAMLFKKKGFKNVKVNHGNKEFGKDLVFSKYDEYFEEEKWYAVIVKNKSAKQNDFNQGNEIGDQIELALLEPYKTPKGELKTISSLFIVINGTVSDNASQLISKFVHPVALPNIKIYDYQDLREQIEKYSESCFLDSTTPLLNLYITEQIRRLSDISSTNNVFDLKTDDIKNIFVDVQTTYSKELRKLNNYVTFEGDEESYIEEDIEGSDEVINSNDNFIIHGIPTSGKTLFLKRIGIKALEQQNGKPFAVFYFGLQDYKSGSINIDNLIKTQYKVLTEDEEFKINEFSKIILLFDSIDFISKKSHQTEIYSKINEYVILNKEGNFQIVIATRDLNFVTKQNGFENYKETELLPFDFGQALQLVEKIIPDNKNKSNSFIKALKNSMLNTTLQRTPLALTLLAILYRDDKIDLKELPANIFALYDRFTDVYLDKWDTSKGVTQLYKYEQTKNILAFIAYHIHEEGISSISEEDLTVFLTDLRKKYNYDELNEINDFIFHLKSQNGVFSYNNVDNSFIFFNHYFQEYFASLCIVDDDSTTLIDNFFDSWWSNSIIFYCGKNPKSNKLHKSIIKEVIPIDSSQKLYYVNQHSKCLQASHSISIRDRAKIVNKLIFEYDNFFKTLLKEGIKDENAIINKLPFVSLLSQSRNLFESIFSSKHISTEETLELFEKILLDDKNELTDITNYNLAYYLSHSQDSGVYFEVFVERMKDEVVWNRVLYVDINFLKLRKKIDPKKYVRIKRKMNKKKFMIQHLLKQNVLEQENEEKK
jgi:hypothetical protein